MTAYHRSEKVKANISAAMTAWWQGRDRPAELRWQHMAAMHSSGWTHREIARGFGITTARVTQLIAKYRARQQRGETADRTRSADGRAAAQVLWEG